MKPKVYEFRKDVLIPRLIKLDSFIHHATVGYTRAINDLFYNAFLITKLVTNAFVDLIMSLGSFRSSFGKTGKASTKLTSWQQAKQLVFPFIGFLFAISVMPVLLALCCNLAILAGYFIILKSFFDVAVFTVKNVHAELKANTEAMAQYIAGESVDSQEETQTDSVVAKSYKHKNAESAFFVLISVALSSFVIVCGYAFGSFLGLFNAVVDYILEFNISAVLSQIPDMIGLNTASNFILSGTSRYPREVEDAIKELGSLEAKVKNIEEKTLLSMHEANLPLNPSDLVNMNFNASHTLALHLNNKFLVYETKLRSLRNDYWDLYAKARRVGLHSLEDENITKRLEELDRKTANYPTYGQHYATILNALRNSESSTSYLCHKTLDRILDGAAQSVKNHLSVWSPSFISNAILFPAVDAIRETDNPSELPKADSKLSYVSIGSTLETLNVPDYALTV